MIQESIQKRVSKFCESWNRVTAHAPVLALDGTWPTAGVIDLLTFRCRKRSAWEPEDEKILKFAASYLGILAHDCWQQFARDVSLIEADSGVILVANAADSLPQGTRFIVDIELQLRRALAEFPIPFPVLGGFERPLSLTHNVISLFSLGLCTGLTPFGDGPWLNETPETFRANIEKVAAFLGRTCVQHYERLYPEEMFGQVGELYLHNLIFPPSCMEEILPAKNVIPEIVKFCKQFQLNPSAIRKLALNLAQSPDELMSGAGIALAAATHKPPLHRGLTGAAQAKGTYIGLLRAAMVEARYLFGLRPDWIFEDDHQDEDVERFAIEKSLGFLPWVYLESGEMKRKEIRAALKPLLAPLALFDMPKAIQLTDKVLGESPGLIDIRLQRLYLDIVNQDFDRADTGFRALLTEPGCEDEPRLFALWGLNDLWREDNRLGADHLKQALEMCPVGHPKRSEIANDCAWAFMVNERFEDALPLVEIAIETNPFPLTSLLNKSFILRVLGRNDEADKLFQQVLPLAPMDRRVFAGIRLDELAKNLD